MAMHAHASGPRSSRLGRLTRFLDQVIQNKQVIRNPPDAKLFLEAICEQHKPSACVERVIASHSGLDSLETCLRLDTTPSFLNGPVSALLRYLQAPEVKQLCNGHFLRQIIVRMVEPPTLWNALFQAHKERTLEQGTVQGFAWLLLELLSGSQHTFLVYQEVAQTVTDDRSLLDSTSLDTRILGHKIKHALLTLTCSNHESGSDKPGGRHDNDHPDFRQISVLPTPDELSSSEPAFLRRAASIEEIEPNKRVAVHLDNHFRLLREDMLAELRTDLQAAIGVKKGPRRGLIIQGLALESIDCGSEQRRKACGLVFRCGDDLPQFTKVDVKKRKEFVIENRNILKHQSVACLIAEEQIVAFATIERNEDRLAEIPPAIILQFSSEAAFAQALIVTKVSTDIQLIQVDTPLFAYEPILRRLQQKTELQLSEELVLLESFNAAPETAHRTANFVAALRGNCGQDLQDLLKTPSSIRLDESQTKSLLAGLTRRVSLIQGPPGTGKSFIGALLAKAFHNETSETILVICYTNHALDQFLEDLIGIGIPVKDMVRLGSKSAPSTKHLSLFEQSSGYKRSSASWSIINDLKAKASGFEQRLKASIAAYRDQGIRKRDLLQYLEFPPEDPIFFEALTVPAMPDDGILIGEDGKAIRTHYLLDRWVSGKNAGVLESTMSDEFSRVWSMGRNMRETHLQRWRSALLEERVSEIYATAKAYNDCQQDLSDMLNEYRAHTIRNKRLVGCTTTGAAMYARELQAFSPGIVIVEEAGEVLETHILTAIGPSTKQLVLIGDHQQLRPKVNNYTLTVEKGQGYDLNRSLFERLVLRGLAHTSLSQQHRMCPSISLIVRNLTYPSLLDAPQTQNRPALRGFQDKVIFVNHDHLEVDAPQLAERRDENPKSSKQNLFEVQMVLKCIRYLGQQGYGTDKIIVLTPYLGQLKLLRDTLSKDHDPILNDLDSYDLVRAGLLPAASAKISKRPIRISTIDNYQGEESHIVIATLTRSNASREIGFLAAPERLNVLLSRARDALIMIGNSATFLNARPGKQIWAPLFDILKREGHVYDGFPVKCERHPDRMAILHTVQDFDNSCPDGGCTQPCGTKLGCGAHLCPQRCHQLYDHSKVPCTQIIQSECPKNHKMSWICSSKLSTQCAKCEAEAKAREKKIQRDYQLELERARRQREYASQMSNLDEQIEFKRQAMRDLAIEEERKASLQQKQNDLAAITAQSDRIPLDCHDPWTRQPHKATSGTQLANTSNPGEPIPKSTPKAAGYPPSDATSDAKMEWDYQKAFQNAKNQTLDSLMEMIGLEEVKNRFLSIKAKVEVVLRQNTDLKDERFGAVLLGNPGTGKTTVARLYAKLLTSLGVLPGDAFVETNGSSLANEGVAGAKKKIEELLNAGGGAFFLDETYQLVSSDSYGGKQVLDFLLAEMENQTGKIAFVLAGYNKQMEAFFEHNPGLISRIPNRLKFEDYSDEELQQILHGLISKKYKGNMKVEGGIDGLYTRIVARRVGRARGREGFGNARAMQTALSRITDRQAERLRLERKQCLSPEDFLLTKGDLIGPEPSKAVEHNAAWTKLQGLIGLSTVKESVRIFLDRIQQNYHRELEEKPLIQCSLNKVFIGSPGTGKTSVAKLYGQILADIGLLSNGEVVLKDPSDFIGDVLGQSESNTKAILASTLGKVLVIDEAYMLCNSSGNQGDIYKSAVIDTIVAGVQSTAGDDRCVLLLGYKDQMEEMFQNVNPGLARRFPMASAFEFEDFTDGQLAAIMDLKLKQQGFAATEGAKTVAMEVLCRARNRPNFGNAGEVDIVLDRAKAHHQKRLSSSKSADPDTFEAEDFDEDFDRACRATTNCRALFKGVVGCEEVIAKLEGYQRIAQKMRQRCLDPREQIPFSFLFRGPPGTGKTSTARRMGQVFYDMGFLAKAEVIECSATDLIGQYVGHTGPKTQKLLESALGKVLFIDEAYRLGEGSFATEAINELVDGLTKPKFSNKLVTILAGYDADINRLMSINPGLTSRFPEAITFDNLGAEQCVQLFIQTLKDKGIESQVLQETSADLYMKMLSHFTALSSLPSWGNARDVQSLAKSVYAALLKAESSPTAELVLDAETALCSLRTMISERSHRATTPESKQLPASPLAPAAISELPVRTTQLANSISPPPLGTDEETNMLEATESKAQEPPPSSCSGRDHGVSDEIWDRLEKDKRAAERNEHQIQKSLSEKETKLQDAEVSEKTRIKHVDDLTSTETTNEQDNNELDGLKRKHEEARLEVEKARRDREQALAELENARKKAEEEKRQEREVQMKLREMGVCVAGYRWIKQAAGYRCAGGSHFISRSALGFD